MYLKSQKVQMEKSLEFSKGSWRMGKYSDFGCKKVAQEILVMWIFCVLTVVVVAQIYKCDKNYRKLNTHIGTHMTAYKTDKIWISSVNYVNVSFLTVILYYCYAIVILCFGGNWVKDPWTQCILHNCMWIYSCLKKF